MDTGIGSHQPAGRGVALILQDDPSQAVLAEAVSMEFGYEPLIINQARHLYTAQHSINPALIVLDLYMDELDGIEITRSLISARSHADVIMTITGDAVASRAAAAMADRAGLFRLVPVVSPIDAPALRAAFEVLTSPCQDNIQSLGQSRHNG
tara:strand:- start:1006 stop:1461 length:456 start_codon:yes stop_codon:yes gene_type:complete